MNELAVGSEIDDLFEVPFYLTASAGILELLAILLLFAGVMIIFTSSKRPGRIMMLVGVAFNAIMFLPYVYWGYEPNFNEFMFWYLPLVSGTFSCIGCLGFFRFALSFKQKV